MITRKFRSSPVKVTGLTPDHVPFESSLEEDCFFLLRFQEDVETFDRPSEAVPWLDVTGVRRTYTPDVLITFKAPEGAEAPPKLLAEIKPDFADDDSPRARLPTRETDEERRMKWAAAKNFAKLRGWEFDVFRESDIRTPFLKNVKFLIRHLERPNKDRGAERLIDALKARGPTPMHALMFEMEPDRYKRALLYPTLYACIAFGRITTDLKVLLKNDSLLTVPT
ncbi:TnsA endonuclease N-terminal domain-containing protein [Paucibacter sp. B2R-40]|uniref:TnsA endonuclease N-terminal domain-containing protein n=1 Tax=Paucibacter sp. B2R-40 TaxID=2893554 RepID=UPI0021E50FE8|nr:TnsA endonuclease N-terminal domain-containing protein [Paucibacter sp. B2R-40]MCV2353160.1 TnsA endonuclease N-terminal domain-containing protein [Paucibacter sp. B2R-40]